MFHLSAVSFLIVVSAEGICAQLKQQQTVTVQVAWNNSGLEAVEGKNGFSLLCVCIHAFLLCGQM